MADAVKRANESEATLNEIRDYFSLPVAGMAAEWKMLSQDEKLYFKHAVAEAIDHPDRESDSY